MALVANLLLVVLSLVLGLRLIGQYRTRPRPHTLWYAVGLLLAAVAAFPEVYLKLTGGIATPLWWLYWPTASGVVGFLAVGTAYLLSPRAGQITLVGAVLLTLLILVFTITTAGPAPTVITDATFAKAPTRAVKIPFVIQSSVGALVILGGAVWSYIKTRGMYAVWITLGTLVFSAGGASSGLLTIPGIFYFTQAAGILLLYLGVSQSVSPRSKRR